MDDDFGVAGRLEQAAAPHQLAPQLIGIRQIAVVADRQPAEFEIGEQWLDVALRHLAGRRIAHMADRDRAGQAVDDVFRAEIVADQPRSAMRVELAAVIRDDAGRFLAAMLQGMQTERRQRGGVRMAIDPEHAAFFVEMIRVNAAGRQHPLPASGIRRLRVR